jgi:hypothetical protein
MHRVWNYISFAVLFAGLGYIVMWLLGSPDLLQLPSSLHVVGAASAIFVPVRLLIRTVGRWRAAAGAMGADPARKPAAIPPPSRRNPTHPLRSVKPRSHFGLRGTPG